ERSGEIRGLVPKNRPPLLLQWGLRRTVHHTDAKHVSRSAGSVLSCRNGLNIQPHLTVLLRSKIHEAPRKIPDLLSAEKLRHWGYRFQLSGRQRGKKVLLGGAWLAPRADLPTTAPPEIGEGSVGRPSETPRVLCGCHCPPPLYKSSCSIRGSINARVGLCSGCGSRKNRRR